MGNPINLSNGLLEAFIFALVTGNTTELASCTLFLMLNIAIINDIHNGPDMGTKKGTAAPALLQDFVKFINNRKPELVIELGDRVNHVNPETDRQSLMQVTALFNQINIPRVHLMGNHDVDFLSIEDNEEILGRSFVSHYEVKNGYSLIYWNGDVHMDKKNGLTLLESDFQWLEKTLKEVSYPAVIFSHVPLNNGSMIGNFYFDIQYPKHAQYPSSQGERLREIIERSGNVIACINGHAHWNAYSCIDGIHYVTLPSLTETFVTYPDPHTAWTWLQLNEKQVDIEIFGNTPMRYYLPIRPETHHWINVDKDYSPIKIAPK